MLYFKKGIRSFNTENWGSVGQRPPKLPAVKVKGHKKKSADRPRPLWTSRTEFELYRGQIILKASWLVILKPFDLKFSALTDLNPFKKLLKVQDTSSSLWVGFALSKWPHFHRVYLVTLCKRSFIAVCVITKKNTKSK